MKLLLQDPEKGRQLRSRIAQRLNVQNGVRLAFSLAAALPDGHFEHPDGAGPSLSDIPACSC